MDTFLVEVLNGDSVGDSSECNTAQHPVNQLIVVGEPVVS